MRLSSTRLIHQVTLLAPDLVDNGRGGRKPNPETGGWKAYGEPWAEIIGLRGEEAVRANVERAVQLWRVEIRIRGDVDTTHRLRCGSIVMDIKTAAPNEARDGLVMTCESGANGK
ncbi:head-tail adaptor protein [Sphingomonas sp. BK235]|uniref:head-tail adaptor protein n=1 Tax=Sphingomonas sp. BK235 TaxID=2512131 RepID=UPI0010433FFE|nr:head-tail adaptor protein [Sphingomonas sp. BK235]TCP33271.1 head-tail adaptor [Sphingomonas sp. BK235]